MAGLWLIIAGLLGEAAVIIFVPSGDLEKTSSVICTLVIALGVWMEEIGAEALEVRERTDAELKLAELNARAAEANARAKSAQLELQRLSSPRKFNFEKFKVIMGDDRATRAKVEVLYVRDCPDCMTLAAFIRLALLGAQWEVLKYGPLEEPTGEQAHLSSAMAVKGYSYGVTVVGKAPSYLPFENKPYGDLNFAINFALGETNGVIGSKDESMPDDVVRVVIAPRP